MKERFDVPIVLFAFKRKKVAAILEVIKSVNPTTLYVLCDGPRNSEEKQEVDDCRKVIDSKLSEFGSTKIVKRYCKTNIGVFENIGLGALWVLSKEKWAIFIEDDNLPERSFFNFCKEMLIRYEEEDKVLWICGTNYLEKYESDYSYCFTRNMLPCGWSTWRTKFVKTYDGKLEQFDPKTYKKFRKYYPSKALFKQFQHAISLEKHRIIDGKKPLSWDYQMDFTIKFNKLYGVCPSFNQITNIGADNFAVHGGSDIRKGLASKFCGKRTYPISFPLIHPTKIEIDPTFEKRIGKVMLAPFGLRLKSFVFGFIRRLFRVPYDVKFKDYMRRKGK